MIQQSTIKIKNKKCVDVITRQQSIVKIKHKKCVDVITRQQSTVKIKHKKCADVTMTQQSIIKIKYKNCVDVITTQQSRTVKDLFPDLTLAHSVWVFVKSCAFFITSKMFCFLRSIMYEQHKKIVF